MFNFQDLQVTADFPDCLEYLRNVLEKVIVIVYSCNYLIYL